jgi:hypothetical protein
MDMIPNVSTAEALGNGIWGVACAFGLNSVFSMDQWFKGLKVVYFKI